MANVNPQKLKAYASELDELTRQIKTQKLILEKNMEAIKPYWSDDVFKEYQIRYKTLCGNIDIFLMHSEKIQSVLEQKITLLFRYLSVR